MRSFLNGQWNFLKSAVSSHNPGTNVNGAAQRGFEHFVDTAWDKGLGSVINGKTFPLIALGLGALGMSHLNHSNPELAGTMGLGLAPVLALGLGAVGFKKASAAGFGKIAAARFAGKMSLAGGAIGTIAGLGLASMGRGSGFMPGALTAAAGIGAIAAAPTVLKAFGKGMFNAAGGVTGIGAGVATAGMAAVGGLTRLARGIEFGARTILTGGVRGVDGALDAWFPYFRNTPAIQGAFSEIGAFRAARAAGSTVEAAAAGALTKSMPNITKYAPNPRIVRRMAGIAAVAGYGSMIKEAITPGPPPATAYFDGRYMRHLNDMGANAHYGNSVMGHNSGLNMDYNLLARQAMLLF